MRHAAAAILVTACLGLAACAQDAGGAGGQADASAPCTAGLGTHFCDSPDQHDPTTGIDPAARSIGGGGSGTH